VRGEKPGENWKEPMIGDRLERPTFAVIRGYDRTQVDAYLADQTSREIEARGRINELEATVSAFEDLAQTSQRDRDRAYELLQHAQADRDEAERKAAEIVEAAHVRASELYEASRLDRREADELVKQTEAERSEVQWRAAEIIESARAEAAALSEESRRDRDYAGELVSQAEAERSEAQWRADEIIESARAEAAALGEESRRDRDYAGGQVDEARQKIELLVEEARQQVEWFTEEVEAAATEGATAVMNGSQPHLDEIRRGLDHLEDQRQYVIGDLSRLRETLDALSVGMLKAG
jgi:F0F1-type ATP synthase membrane subunit b/b'